MKQKNNTSNDIYETLKKRILCLEYKPGFSLSALTISEEMNVSRSPAREALIKLASDNLVEIFPQIGTRVSLINLNKVSEERFLRKSLEESALRIFSKKNTNTDLQTMEELVEMQKKSLENKDYIHFLHLDDNFHKIIFSSIGKPQCWNLMNNFASNEFRLRLLSCQYIKETPETVLTNHRELIQSLKEGSLSKSLEITHEHLSRISNEIPKLLEDFPEIFSLNSEHIDNRFQRNFEQKEINFLQSI